MKKLLCIIIALSVTMILSATASANPKTDLAVNYLENGTALVGVMDGGVPTGWCALYLSGEHDGSVFFGYFEDGKASGFLCRKDGTFVEHTFNDLEIAGKQETPNESSSNQNADESTVTMGMKNALKSAEQYLDVMPFSYTGLIEQLEFSQYTHEEAVYAADHCGADWNEQAVKSAEQYLSLMSFSRKGLIDQLEYSGFTHSQAEYAAKQCGY